MKNLRCTYRRDLEDEDVRSPEYKNAPEYKSELDGEEMSSSNSDKNASCLLQTAKKTNDARHLDNAYRWSGPRVRLSL